MNLSELHTQVRDLARRGGASRMRQADAATVVPLSPAERAALGDLRRRLLDAGGDLARLVPASGADMWTSAPRPQPGA